MLFWKHVDDIFSSFLDSTPRQQLAEGGNAFWKHVDDIFSSFLDSTPRQQLAGGW